VDVREVVGTIPPGSVDLEDSAWDVLPRTYSLREIRAAIRGLGDPDLAVVEKSLAKLARMLCGEGTTDPTGALFVPSLIRAPAHVGPHLRAKMLQLVGDMSRVEPTTKRPRLLRTMQTIPVYDATGGLENWSVEAVRAMAGRDGDLLSALMQDDSPEVRGRAAYVLAAAEPVSFDVPGFMHARLAVESDPAVQTILILCIAQYEKDQDRTADALAWARSLVGSVRGIEHPTGRGHRLARADTRRSSTRASGPPGGDVDVGGLQVAAGTPLDLVIDQP
jgi:hypothetical protein